MVTAETEAAAQVQVAARAVVGVGKLVGQLLEVFENPHGPSLHALTVFGQGDTAAGAGEQGGVFAVVAEGGGKLGGPPSRSTAEIAEMISKILAETRDAVVSMNATQEGAQRGVTLADQAGSVILQIRNGTSDAVEAVSMFASKLDESEVIPKTAISWVG